MTMWAYIDESGDHYPKSHKHHGKFRSLTLGGCIAECDDWRRFEIEWSRVLGAYKVDMLHMVELENSHPYHRLYRGWPHAKRADFASKFLRILRSLGMLSFFGATIEPIDPAEKLGTAYLKKAAEAVLGAIRQSSRHGVVNMVFADNKSVETDKLLQIATAVKLAYSTTGTLTFDGNPRHVLPLQVADFAAYEIRKFTRSKGDMANACPYFQTLKLGPHSISIPELDGNAAFYVG